MARVTGPGNTQIARFLVSDLSTASNIINALTLGMQRQISRCESSPDSQILDFSFKDVNDNPVEVLEFTYQFLDLELSDEIVAKVKEWDAFESYLALFATKPRDSLKSSFVIVSPTNIPTR